MFESHKKKWLDFVTESRKKPRRRYRPSLVELEDRVVPTVLDLTTVGASGYINKGLFQQFSQGPGGSGTFGAFVKLSSNSAVEQGYNTDFRPVQFDETSSSSFTRAIQLNSVPTVLGS